MSLTHSHIDMNRLQVAGPSDNFLLAPPPASSTPSGAARIVRPRSLAGFVSDGDWDAASSGCHALFAPLHYEPGYAYPLIIWLHGPGGNEDELPIVMPEISLRNYIGAAPRGVEVYHPRRADAADQPLAGDAADDDEAARFNWRQSEDHILLAEQRVFGCLDYAHSRYNIAPERVFLVGYRSGGTMALRIALAHPDRFAGVVSLAGGLSRRFAPLSRLREARDLPVLLGGGQDGVLYSQRHAADDLRLLHSAGVSTIVKLYPGGDELSDLMLTDVDRWIMQQLFPTPEETTLSECDTAS